MRETKRGLSSLSHRAARSLPGVQTIIPRTIVNHVNVTVPFVNRLTNTMAMRRMFDEFKHDIARLLKVLSSGTQLFTRFEGHGNC